MTPSTHFTAGNTPDAPRSDLPGLLDPLPAMDLRGIGYTVDGVAGLLGPAAHSALSRDQLVPALIATEAARHGEPTTAALAAVVRLWLLAEPQPRRNARRRPARRPHGRACWSWASWSRADGRAWSRRRWICGRTAGTEPPRKTPRGRRRHGSGGAELWVASDLAAHQRPGVLRHDHVLGIGQASTTLVQVTARRHVARALDLGTGCGIQTFHLLHHAEHVTATDISDRALAFTRFNLLLNAGAAAPGPRRPGSPREPAAGAPCSNRWRARSLSWWSPTRRS